MGVRRAGRVEVTDGLQPGGTIVTAGQQRVQRDGTVVRVVDVSRSAAASEGGQNRISHRRQPGPCLTSFTDLMQLAEISIRRPVFATVRSLLILLVGAVSFNRLAEREYPKIDEPVVTVTVRYPGASAEVIESQISKPLEDSIAGIDAVDVTTSTSRAEQSQISVRFRLEYFWRAQIRHACLA